MHKSIEKMRRLWMTHPTFIVLILFTFLAAAVSRCNLLDPVKFILVQFAFIFLPGYALQRLTKLSYQNSLVRLLVSYATGYAISLVVYLAMLIVGIQQYVLLIYVVIFIISTAYLYFSKKDVVDGVIEQKEKLYFTCVLLAALIASMVLFQFANIIPTLKQSNASLYQDLVFWMRNAVAATKGYPLPELSVAGKAFFYHYFTSINIAFLRFTTGIEIYDLCFVYSYLVTVLLIVSGLYVACKEMINSYKIALIVICFILFTKNLDPISHIYFNDHIFRVSFGFAEGLGMFFFVLYYYIRMMRHDGNKWMLLLVAMLLFFAETGLKGPFAAILLVGIATGSFIMVFFRNRLMYGTLSGIALLAVFLITLGLFVMNFNGDEAVSNHARLSISAVDTLFHSGYFKIAYLRLTGMGIWKPIAYIIILVSFLISAIFIPLLMVIVAFKKRKITNEDMLLIVMILTGVALGLFVSQGGMSQGYFIDITIPLIFIFVLISYRGCDIDKGKKIRLLLTFVAGLALWCLQYRSYFIKNSCLFVRSNPTLVSLIEKAHPLKKIEVKESGLTINKLEIDGLRWLRENSSSNSVVLSNKVLSSDMGSRSFWVSSISERQAFFESYDYSNVSKEMIKDNCSLISTFYEGNLDAYHSIKKKGVTHAVIFKDIQPNSYPIVCKEIYKNDKIIIVEL